MLNKSKYQNFLIKNLSSQNNADVLTIFFIIKRRLFIVITIYQLHGNIVTFQSIKTSKGCLCPNKSV